MISDEATYNTSFIALMQNPEGGNPSELLLEPLFQPEPVAFSFDTPAWYALGGLLVIIISYGIWRWYRNFKHNSYRRMAIKSLNSLRLEATPLLETQIVLKQVAMKSYGRKMVASLYGIEWLQFLERTGKNTPFTQCNEWLEFHRENIDEEHSSKMLEFLEFSKKWIKTHA